MVVNTAHRVFAEEPRRWYWAEVKSDIARFTAIVDVHHGSRQSRDANGSPCAESVKHSFDMWREVRVAMCDDVRLMRVRKVGLSPKATFGRLIQLIAE